MNIHAIINELRKWKLPSLLIILFFGWFGWLLLKNNPPFGSTSGIAGLLCIGVMLLTGIYAFVEHRLKEYYEGIISTQQTAMKNLSRTNSAYEQSKRKTASSGGLEPQGYKNLQEVTTTEADS